jgi:polysaccharide biosynthesis protein VpsQ
METRDPARERTRPWRVAAYAYLGFILLILLLAYLGRIPAILGRIPHYDTIGHFVLLGIASYLGHRAMGHRSVRVLGAAIPLAPLLISSLALTEEALQGLSPNRTLSAIDYAADLAGIWGAWALNRWASTRARPADST